MLDTPADDRGLRGGQPGHRADRQRRKAPTSRVSTGSTSGSAASPKPHSRRHGRPDLLGRAARAVRPPAGGDRFYYIDRFDNFDLYEQLRGRPGFADIVARNTGLTGLDERIFEVSNEDNVPVALPVVDAPVVDAPVVDAPVVDAPVVDAPVVDAPVVDAPVVDAPVVDAPVVDAPVVDAPVVDAPVVDAPVVDAPVVDAPVVDAPVVDAPW